jgi:hypothetical protein
MQPRSLADDAATIADREVAVACRKDRGKRPGAGRRNPQPQQVPLALRLRPILVSRARVQDRMIMWMRAGMSLSREFAAFAVDRTG